MKQSSVGRSRVGEQIELTRATALTRNKFFYTRHETSCHETSFFTRHETSCRETSFFFCHETSCHETRFLTRHETSCHETKFFNPPRNELPRNEFFLFATKRVPRNELFLGATKRAATKRVETRGQNGYLYTLNLIQRISIFDITSVPELTKVHENSRFSGFKVFHRRWGDYDYLPRFLNLKFTLAV